MFKILKANLKSIPVLAVGAAVLWSAGWMTQSAWIRNSRLPSEFLSPGTQHEVMLMGALAMAVMASVMSLGYLLIWSVFAALTKREWLRFHVSLRRRCPVPYRVSVFMFRTHISFYSRVRRDLPWAFWSIAIAGLFVCFSALNQWLVDYLFPVEDRGGWPVTELVVSDDIQTDGELEFVRRSGNYFLFFQDSGGNLRDVIMIHQDDVRKVRISREPK